MDHVEHIDEDFVFEIPQSYVKNNKLIERLSIADILSKGLKLEREISKEEICSKMEDCCLPASLQVRIMRYLDNSQIEVNMKTLGEIMYELFPEFGRKVKESIDDGNGVEEWTRGLNEDINNLAINDQLRRDIVQGIVTHYLVNELNNSEMLLAWRDRGGVR